MFEELLIDELDNYTKGMNLSQMSTDELTEILDNFFDYLYDTYSFDLFKILECIEERLFNE